MWTNKDGTKNYGNVWLRRLGLFIIIVAIFGDFFRNNLWLFWLILILILSGFILSMIFGGIFRFFKDIFK